MAEAARTLTQPIGAVPETVGVYAESISAVNKAAGTFTQTGGSQIGG